MNSQADNRAQEVKTIFLESLDREAGVERRSYLDEACGSDAELRGEVESLLLAHEKAGEFLDPAAFGAGLGPDQPSLTEGPGTVIGRYKLLEKIGEGGMAVVYMAEQTEPIRRKVALKIIKLGMDTRQVIARFEAERQALALMDHPSIAKVLDAGATETGRPYFVMELVTGRLHHRVLRQEQPEHQGPTGPVSPGLPRRAARPPKGHHPPGYQALQCHGHAP